MSIIYSRFQAALYLFAGLLFLFLSTDSNAQEKQTINVAIASSMVEVMQEIASTYNQQETENDIVLSIGSSGLIDHQIRQSAPYDLVLFADIVRAQNLINDGFGIDVFELPASDLVFVSRVEFDQSELSAHIQTLERIAIANPATAPYGQAAESWLDQNVGEELQAEVVVAQNVRSAYEYFISGDVNGAFVPQSFLLLDQEKEIYSSDALKGILQQGLLMSDDEQTRKAMNNIINSKEVWQRFGYTFHSDSIEDQANLESTIVTQKNRSSFSILHPLLITLQVSFFATILAFIFGTVAAYFLYDKRSVFGKIFENLILLPLVLPPTVLGFYLLVLISSQSPIGSVYESIFGSPLAFTKIAAIIAATIGAFPFVARQMIAAFRSIPLESLEAARLDGASSWKLLAMILLPLVRPSIISSLSLALAKSIGDFGATVMVAASIPGKTQTASLAIYDSVMMGNWANAFALSGILIGLSIFLLFLTSFIDYDENQLARFSGRPKKT